MIDWTEIATGEEWEFFARDFLVELGFGIELDPGRGADAGRDLVITEQLKGNFRQQTYRWLVSCKHNARSGASVGSIEADITDRCKRNNCSGFIGFYSTMPSASLIQRLHDLRSRNDIDAFEIFDAKKIEGAIQAHGMSKVVLRYLPTSYGRVRPIAKLFDQYQPLLCSICGRDLLKASASKPYSGNIVMAMKCDNEGSANEYDEVHVVCKGKCDRQLEHKLWNKGLVTGWEDIGDLCNPLLYLKHMMSYMNKLHYRHDTLSQESHKRIKEIYIALAQKNLRDTTKEDEKRFIDLQNSEML